MMNIGYPANAIMCFNALVDVANMCILPKEYFDQIVSYISFWENFDSNSEI